MYQIDIWRRNDEETECQKTIINYLNAFVPNHNMVHVPLFNCPRSNGVHRFRQFYSICLHAASIDFFYMTDHGISIAEIYDYVIYYGVIFLILIPAVLFGKRVFCHYFCWMAPFMVIGTKIRHFFHLPGLHVAAEKERCISCKKCNQNCPMGINVAESVKENRDFGAECIECGSCVDNCPKGALSYDWKRGK